MAKKASSTVRKARAKKVIQAPETAPETTAPEQIENYKELPLIHVIVRTHRRPNYFERCISSIEKQVGARKMVHVIADDAASGTYALKALQDGRIDNLINYNPADFKNDFSDFGPLARSGARNSDRNKHVYDLYLNRAIEQHVPSGWVIIIDDDTVLTDELTLSRISEYLTDEDTVIIGQYQMKTRVLPEGDLWGKLPFLRAHVDMSCVVFNVKHRKLAKLDGHGAGDFRMTNKLAANLKPVWVKEVFSIADNDGNFGKGEF